MKKLKAKVGERKYNRCLINSKEKSLKGCLYYLFHVSRLVFSIALALQTIHCSLDYENANGSNLKRPMRNLLGPNFSSKSRFQRPSSLSEAFGVETNAPPYCPPPSRWIGLTSAPKENSLARPLMPTAMSVTKLSSDSKVSQLPVRKEDNGLENRIQPGKNKVYGLTPSSEFTSTPDNLRRDIRHVRISRFR